MSKASIGKFAGLGQNYKNIFPSENKIIPKQAFERKIVFGLLEDNLIISLIINDIRIMSRLGMRAALKLGVSGRR